MGPHLVDGIHPMAAIYREYCDIMSSSDSTGKKAPLAVLSVYADSEGQTGMAALDGLRILKLELNSYLLDASHFSCFYQFVYFICRERGQRNMLVCTGLEAWRLVLTGRFCLLDQWCDFVKEHQRYTIPEDTWLQLLTFSMIVHEDLSNYDPEGSWPVLIDEFVEHMIRNLDRRNVEYASVHIKGLSFDAEGKSSQIACKKRWLSSFEEEVGEVESVNCIAQRLAKMPSPLFSKRIRSSYSLSESSERMEVN